MSRHLLEQTRSEMALLRKTRIHAHTTAGERIADQAAALIGSWRFIIIQTVAVLCWVGLNAAGIWLQWDPYPFILLNLMFSVQAAYTGPILLLASNRQSQKDRQRDDLEAQEVGEMLTLNRNQVDHDERMEMHAGMNHAWQVAVAMYLMNPTPENTKRLKEVL